MVLFFFFFSSRRRHTRFDCDWSSDVCSSDLAVTERWVFWQARARADAPIVTSGLTSYVELWRAVSSQVNLVAGAGRVQGGEAGVTYRPPKRPFSLRLAYRVDDAAVRGGGGGRPTVEAINPSG